MCFCLGLFTCVAASLADPKHFSCAGKQMLWSRPPFDCSLRGGSSCWLNLGLRSVAQPRGCAVPRALAKLRNLDDSFAVGWEAAEFPSEAVAAVLKNDSDALQRLEALCPFGLCVCVLFVFCERAPCWVKPRRKTVFFVFCGGGGVPKQGTRVICAMFVYFPTGFGIHHTVIWSIFAKGLKRMEGECFTHVCASPMRPFNRTRQ